MPKTKTETTDEPQIIKKRRGPKKSEADKLNAPSDASAQTTDIAQEKQRETADIKPEHPKRTYTRRKPQETQQTFPEAAANATNTPQSQQKAHRTNKKDMANLKEQASSTATTDTQLQEKTDQTEKQTEIQAAAHDAAQKQISRGRRVFKRNPRTLDEEPHVITEAAEQLPEDAAEPVAPQAVLTAAQENEPEIENIEGILERISEEPADAMADDGAAVMIPEVDVIEAEFADAPQTDISDARPEELLADDADAQETKYVKPQRPDFKQTRHQHPKLGFNQLAPQTLAELRKIAKEIGVSSITTRRKDDLINDILKTQAEALGYRYNGGTLECMSDGYGFLRPSGLLPSNNDIYVSASQIKRFGLRNGDVVWGIIRPPKEQEHYEALLRVENVNFSDPEAARRRPHFEALVPIFPEEKLNLETDRKQIATRIVDIFAPIGKGQRALIVSPPKAGKTTLLKSLAHSITTNHPEVILMVLLIDERPDEVTDMARSVDGEIIASTFDRPAEEHLRVAGLALEKAKRLVEVDKDVVLLLDSITRLARASNLIVPPSGRTLSGGMDPAALYFPKKFFGAARNIENGGSLTIIGTSLVETGSRMDDVIYEEFKGTGNMEVHLSRKISEQRIFPALDITKSGTRKEELMVPDDDLKRIWGLRRKISNMDEAEVLNLILDKLRNTPTNRDFLATIKAG